MQIVAQAAADHGQGIVVHNDAQHFSAGVDLNQFLALSKRAAGQRWTAFLLASRTL